MTSDLPPISPATPEDHPAIDALLRAAFPGPEEADLVRVLRARLPEDPHAGEWVMRQGACAIAYAALWPLVAPAGWLSLAPVAVLPDWQGRGLGRGLVRALVARTAPRTRIIVLGRPAFYRSCGFSSERAARLISDYPVSHLLLAGPGQGAPARRLVYPAAFAGV